MLSLFPGVRRGSQSPDIGLSVLDDEFVLEGDVVTGEDIFLDNDDDDGGIDGEMVCKRAQPAVESGADAAEEGTEAENGGGTPCCCHRCSRGNS